MQQRRFMADPMVVENPLAKYWDQPVSRLVAIPPATLSPGAAERHRIYSLLVMATVSHYWNGNKRGNSGEYPWREGQKLPNGSYGGGDYQGHNIACVAVDGLGQLIDFDFNHNDLFSSSVEHAESRLVRRIFSISPIYNDWETRKHDDPAEMETYSTVLDDVTIYTSLESCAQCAGIMALGRVKEVVYLQQDPGMYLIGNILHNLTKDSKLRAPRPIAAEDYGFEYFSELNAGYERFAREVGGRPFHRSDKRTDADPSLTSFLCTDNARDIFRRAGQEFLKLESLAQPDYKSDDHATVSNPRALTNQQALGHAKSFFSFVARVGKRGTPHQL